jgi:hypothetical protein
VKELMERLELHDDHCDDARSRSLGWIAFYERDLLPEYGHILDPECVSQAKAIIRRANTMRETAAAASELQAELAELRECLHGGRLGALVTALQRAAVRGVTERTLQKIHAAARSAVECLQQGNEAGWRRQRKALEELSELAEHEWRCWDEARDVQMSSPDLTFGDD